MTSNDSIRWKPIWWPIHIRASWARVSIGRHDVKNIEFLLIERHVVHVNYNLFGFYYYSNRWIARGFICKKYMFGANGMSRYISSIVSVVFCLAETKTHGNNCQTKAHKNVPRKFMRKSASVFRKTLCAQSVHALPIVREESEFRIGGERALAYANSGISFEVNDRCRLCVWWQMGQKMHKSFDTLSSILIFDLNSIFLHFNALSPAAPRSVFSSLLRCDGH